MRWSVFAWGLVGLAGAASVSASEGFATLFTAAEFGERRARVMDEIGEGVAVVQGSTEWSGFRRFRQNAQFYYLTGVEVPRAVVVIDGKQRTTTLYLTPPAPPPPGSSAGIDPPGTMRPDAATAKLTGVEKVADRAEVMSVLATLAREGRTFFAPFRSESRSGSPEVSTSLERANALDPLDGRPSREMALVQKLSALSARPTQDLDPIVDRMRLIKSPAEVAVLREAARISQLGLMEAMRTSRPGVYEYEIVAAAEYEFRYHNAFGPGYFPVCATGVNGHWGHYHTAQSQLGPSEFVLFDYGPDYQYYLSDITRMWPSNGKFTARQREMYAVYLELYQALESSLRPRATPAEIIRDAADKMDRVLARFEFRDPKIRSAASAFVEHFRKDKFPGHGIGMEIHDPPVPYREPTVVWEALQPGMVITIEPIMRLPEERIMLRLEDIYVITETGFDKLSTLAPVEPAAIERLMSEQGATRGHRSLH